MLVHYEALQSMHMYLQSIIFLTAASRVFETSWRRGEKRA